MIDFPDHVKPSLCAWRSHTINIPTNHGMVRMVVPISNWIVPLAVTKKMGGYS